ncbi:MAG TPA: hypothetical protein VKY74_22845, partial [Chloroflexia bacterium]|nr:hypothetical protein [Chloroflexia bacterium]
AALARYANRESEGYYRAALALAPPPAEQTALLAGLAAALRWQGRLPELIATGRAAARGYLAQGDFDQVARLYGLMVIGAFFADDRALIAELIQEGLAAIAGQPETGGQALLLSHAAMGPRLAGDLVQARQILTRACALAERFQETEMQADILCTLAAFPDQAPAAQQTLLQQVLALADADRPMLAIGRAHSYLGLLLCERLGQWQAAIPQYQAGVAIARRLGAPLAECWSRAQEAEAWLEGGRLAEAAALLPALQALAQHLVDPQGAQATVLWVAAQHARYQAGARARPILEQALAGGQASHNEVIGNGSRVLPLLADLLLELGQPAAAEALLRDALAGATRRQEPTLRLRSLLATAYARQGRPRKAAATLAAAQREAGAPLAPPEAAALALAAARLALARGAGPAADAAFAATVAQEAQMDRRWYQARALWEWGRAGGAAGAPARARLIAARDLFAAAGATYYVEQVAADLRAADAPPAAARPQ